MNYFIQLFIWHQEIIIDFIPHAISKSLLDATFQEYFKWLIPKTFISNVGEKNGL